MSESSLNCRGMAVGMKVQQTHLRGPKGHILEAEELRQSMVWLSTPSPRVWGNTPWQHHARIRDLHVLNGHASESERVQAITSPLMSPWP